MTTLITFLGPTSYVNLRYRLQHGDNHREVQTPFVARALCEFFNCDKVFVLATDFAWQRNGERLREALHEFQGSDNLHVERVSIPNGEDDRQQRQQFRLLMDCLQDGPESGERAFVLDITHGWRVQSFFASTAIMVLMASGKLPDDMRIVYGAAPPGAKEGDIAPIWDLSHYLLMLEVAQGLGVFQATGQAGPLLQALRKENQRARRMAVQQNVSPQERNTNGLISALEAFHADFTQLRVPNMTIGPESGKSSSQELLNKLDEYAERCKREHPALLPLLDDIRSMLAPLPCETLSDRQGHAALAHLARLYLERDQLAEAANVAREGLVCLYADGPAGTDGGRAVFDEAARMAAECHFRAETENRGLAGIRNDLEHCGFRSNPAHSLHKGVRKLVEAFEEKVFSSRDSGRVLFVTRHAGALEWARRQGIEAEVVPHLDVKAISPGDTVIGTLPVHLVAEINARGARYLHLTLNLPPEMRGKELSADDMERCGARLQEFTVRRK